MIQTTTPSNYAYDRALADHAALEQQKQERIQRLMSPKSVSDLVDLDHLDCAIEQSIAAIVIFASLCIIAGFVATTWTAKVIVLVFIVTSAALVTWAYLTGQPSTKTKETSHV